MAWPGFCFGRSGQEGAADSLGSWQDCPAGEWQLGRRAEDSWWSACPGYHRGPQDQSRKGGSEGNWAGHQALGHVYERCLTERSKPQKPREVTVHGDKWTLRACPDLGILAHLMQKAYLLCISELPSERLHSVSGETEA